ncbi:hypothetical protein ACFYTU_06630 [Nonomuraea angiospora]|uniref:hypothetical protein n=1 Tax=Nonomuraea angiospora TaxID=46172 RepID=UPI0036C4FD3C
MRTRVAGGLCLLASSALCLAGCLAGEPALCPARQLAGTGPALGLVRSTGAWLAVVAVALVYRDLSAPGTRHPDRGPGTRHPDRGPEIRHPGRAPAAVVLALLGVVASAATVEAALHVAGPVLPPALAVGAACALAGLSYVAVRAGLAHPVAGGIAAAAALLGALTGDLAAPYLLGAGPLGAALLVKAFRSPSKGQAP